MSFSKIFQILFIVDSTFLFFMVPECLNNSWWCFSSSFSTFEDRRRISLESWSVLLKIHGSYLLPSSQIISNRVILFLPIRSISELFSFLDHLKAIIWEDFFVLSFQLRSPIILNWCLFVHLHILPVHRSSMIWVRVSWFTCCQEWDILNPPISSLDLSCVMFHLEPSLRNVANCGV